MAESIHLYLKIAGVEIKGESTQTSLGRQDSIQCLYFDHSVATAREPGTGLATGRRQYSPIVIHKQVDKSTPLLFKALTSNQVIEGTFKFFRPNPKGDGTSEQFYTIVIKKGRISSMRNYVSDILVPATAALPVMEEVSFTFEEITWTYTNGGVTHQDSWGALK